MPTTSAWLLIVGFFFGSFIPLGLAWRAWLRRPPSADRIAQIARSVCFGVLEMGVAGVLLTCLLTGVMHGRNQGYIQAVAGMSLVFAAIPSFAAGGIARRWYLRNASGPLDYDEDAVGNSIRAAAHKLPPDQPGA